MNSSFSQDSTRKRLISIGIVLLFCCGIPLISGIDLYNLWGEQAKMPSLLLTGMPKEQVYAQFERMGNITYQEPPGKDCTFRQTDEIKHGVMEYWVIRSRLQPWFFVRIGICFSEAGTLEFSGDPDS